MYIALLWEIIHLKSISLTPHSRFSASTMKSCLLNDRTWRNWTQWTKWPVLTSTGGNICIWPCWHSMLSSLSKYFCLPRFSVTSPILHDFPHRFLFYFIFGCVRREKMSFALKRNCDGKSHTICKIEYHINIEFLPNDKHILHLTSVTAKKWFFHFMCAICLTNDSAAILTATE